MPGLPEQSKSSNFHHHLAWKYKNQSPSKAWALLSRSSRSMSKVKSHWFIRHLRNTARLGRCNPYRRLIQLLSSMFAQHSPIKLCLYNRRYLLLYAQLPVTTQLETQTIWRLATEQIMSYEGCGTKRSCSTWRYYSGIYLNGLQTSK